jgi:hypothetical protein
MCSEENEAVQSSPGKCLRSRQQVDMTASNSRTQPSWRHAPMPCLQYNTHIVPLPVLERL